MTSSAHDVPRTTTNAGIPVESDEHSLSVAPTARCCSRTTT